MTANQSYLPKPIQPGDPRGFKGFEHDGLIHQPRRLEFRQPVVIAGLRKNKAYDIDFANKLKHNMLVTGISCDIKNDDGNTLQDGTNNYRFTYVQCIIQSLEKETRRVLRTINIYISSYPNTLNELILNPDFIYRIKLNQDVNDITLIGVPLILEAPVVFYSPPQAQE